ncbi:MAG TPA: HAD hydrolase family protein [Sandaracinaceae bacterium LLY-WYZ-13_1]|nr:HAD hydrolase family protein [Sandaracinaceae bacterium LLY-WYZ-13_1]
MALPAELRETAASIELLVLDVDGVLTDGTLWYGAEGEVLKAFHVRDGLGIKLARQQGVEVAVISGKTGAPLKRRLDVLGVERAHLGCEDKGAALDALLADVGCDAARAAHVGDDLIDLPVFERVGLPIAVADAHPLAREAARWVTERAGGRGAVREVTDALVEARGDLREAFERYLSARRAEGEP